MKKKEYRSFNEARKFVRSLELKSNREWYEYCKSGKKPVNIPSSPKYNYKNDFKGSRDWLGTNTIAPQDKVFRPYKEARDFVHKLNLKTQKEWQKYAKSTKRPGDIPGTPEASYKNLGWEGYGGWLGTGRTSNQDRLFLPYNQAKKVVQKVIWNGNSLGSGTDFGNWSKSGNRPKNIPSAPDRTYKKEKTWQSWGDFLGTKRVAFQNKQYLSFEDARKFVHKLNLKSRKYWEDYCKSGNKPDEISSSPHVTYKKEWKGVGDWLGTGTIDNSTRSKNFLSAKEAKPMYKKLFKEYGIKNGSDWPKFAKTHKKLLEELHLPLTPLHFYTKSKAEKKLKKKSRRKRTEK
jgi:hypothetical protein